jgi:hypothetical protein
MEPAAVIADVEAGIFDGVNSANNNAAGALLWSLPNLDLLPGQTTQFTVDLVPDPGTLGLIPLGAFCCSFRGAGSERSFTHKSSG